MIIKTKDEKVVKKIIKKIYLPKKNSYKGENGKILVIGGSSLFHSASLWAAEIASFFVDIVHYFSTKENEKVFIKLKSKFRNGMVVRKNKIIDYVKEDDVILIGPGMVRNKKIKNLKLKIKNLTEILYLNNEAEFTYQLTGYLVHSFPKKKFVFDAGSLQMMDKDWFYLLLEKPIITPHQVEFEQLFDIKIKDLSFNDKIKIVEEIAQKYKVVILLKAIKDIISDGKQTFVIEGGNQGLTKGGTGDLLAGLASAFYCKNEALLSAVSASLILKKTADYLYNEFGYWYNIDNLLTTIPKIFKQLVLN